MTDDTPTDNPTIDLVINGSPTTQQINQIARSVILTASSFALGRGWISGDVAQAIVGLVGVLGPVVVAQVMIVMHKRELLKAATTPAAKIAIK